MTLVVNLMEIVQTFAKNILWDPGGYVHKVLFHKSLAGFDHGLDPVRVLIFGPVHSLNPLAPKVSSCSLVSALKVMTLSSVVFLLELYRLVFDI